MASNSIFNKIRKNTLIIVTVIVAVIAVIMGIGLYVINLSVKKAGNALGESAANDAKQALTRQIEESLSPLAKNQAALIDEQLTIIINYVELMSYAATTALSSASDYRSALNNLSAIILDAITNSSRNNLALVFYYGTEQGDFIVPENNRVSGYFDPRTRPWYIKAKSQNSLIWTEIYDDIEERGLAITCAKPFYGANGQIAGISGAGFLVKSLENIVASAHIGNTGHSFTMDDKGQVIIPETKENEEIKKFIQENFLQANLQYEDIDENPGEEAQDDEIETRQIDSGIERILLNGKEKFIAYHGIKSIPWSVAVVIDTDEVILPALEMEENIIKLTQSTINFINRIILIIAIAFGKLILLTALSVSHFTHKLAKDITEPIQKLTEDAVLIGSGNLDHAIEVKSGDELETLSDTFNAMITNIKTISAEKDRALEEKKALTKFADIMNGLDSMIYVTDPETDEILFINDRMKEHYKIEDDCTGKICYKVLQKDHEKRCSFCPCLQLDNEPDKIVVWEEHNTLTNLIYRNVDRYIDWSDGKTVHIQNSFDMTELISAREQAEQSNRSKSVFLAHMSHEIRTPMNAILGIAEIKLQDKTLAPDTEEAFGKIFESGELLLNIINDILDLSKIESGKLELIQVKYDIPSLINDTAQLNRLRYESKPILFTLHIDENTPIELYGDELRIKQILNNILSNAFKYTLEGKVEFSVSAEIGQKDDVIIIFRISDTGQGMSEEQIGRLFQEYTRFNMLTNRTTVGAGLGMTITKRLLDFMDGTISVESEQCKGSVFTVRIPQKRISDEVCGTEIAEKLRDFSFHSMSIIKKTQYLREYMPYGNVLVVDDVESNIYVVSGMLAPYGLKIDTSFSGIEAVEKIKTGTIYDIIFMDHMMPVMDGIEATKIIRNMGYNSAIIALTANALIGHEEMFLRNGFDGFISKPIDSRELNSVLNDFIRNRQPPEVVEAARKEQHERELYNLVNPADTKKKTFEKELLFVRDARKALNVLEKQDLRNPGEDTVKQYITAVHGMKSALANIGEKALSSISFKLEQAGKDGNTALLQKETPDYIAALQSLIRKLNQVKEDSGAGNTEISDENAIYLRRKMLEIKTACGAFDKSAVKAALNELKQKTWPNHLIFVFEKISMHILHSEFEEAEETAESTANQYLPTWFGKNLY